MKTNNGDGKGAVSSFAHSLLSDFHEPETDFETLRTDEDALLLFLRK